MLDSSPLERYDVHIKLMYRQNSKSVSTNIAETVKVMSRELDYGLANEAPLTVHQSEAYCPKRSTF